LLRLEEIYIKKINDLVQDLKLQKENEKEIRNLISILQRKLLVIVKYTH
jgi:hypothetical protein